MAQEQTTQTIFQWTDEEKAVLSPEQIEICEMKILGEFQSKIMKKFQLSSLSNITTAICCTINGNIWKPGANLGGRNPLLSDVDTFIFKKEIKARGYDLNCLSSKEGIALIYELRENRYLRGIRIANICAQRMTLCKSYLDTIEKLRPNTPSDGWFYSFCNNNNIILKTKDSLERARQECCNRYNVNNFFIKFKEILENIDKRLLFNCDETSSASSRKFKSLVLNKKDHGTTVVSPTEPHISVMICYNAAGFKLNPFIILPNLYSIPQELKDLQGFFVSQKNGWMTRNLFSAFSLYFVSTISHYRQTLHPELRNKPIVLIADNHSSRRNAFAALCFKLHNVILLTLPAHSTHVMQPFDVGVASTLKSKMANLKLSKAIKERANQLSTAAGKARYLTVSSIIQAWNEIPTESLQNSFKDTGLSPFNPNVAIFNRRTNPIYHPISNNRRDYFNTCCENLTTDDNILTMYNVEQETTLQSIDEIPKPFYNLLPTFFSIRKISSGFILSDFSPLYLPKDQNNIQFIRVI